MADFYIRQGDRREALVVTLKDANGAAIDLSSGVSGVTFHMRNKLTDVVKVDAAASIVTAEDGIVQYEWAEDDTDTTGDFLGEFEVTFSSGLSPLTFPNKGNIEIEVTRQHA